MQRERCRVVAGERLGTGRQAAGEDGDDDVDARLGVDRLVEAQEAEVGDVEPGFLLHLAADGVGEAFAELHPAAGQAELAGEGLAPALHEKHFAVGEKAGGNAEDDAGLRRGMGHGDGLTHAEAPGQAVTMTKRFALTHAPSQVADALRLDALDPFPPRYNIAPTQPVLLVFGDRSRVYDRAEPPVRRAMLARWGFIPGWAKDPSDVPLLVNARCETAGERPAFRGALRHRRCLLPASAFYLWREAGTPRSVPFLVRPRDGRVLALAGLFETFMAADGSEIDTALILTREASRPLASIADRVPIAVSSGDQERWLDCGTAEPGDLADILARPAPAEAFETVRLTSLVNDPAHMGPEVQRPAEAPGDEA